MSWFSNIFGTSTKAVDTVANIADGAVKGIDAIWYTDEEKAENSLKIAELKADLTKKYHDFWLETQKATAGENTKKSMARRFIAHIVVSVFLILIIASAIVSQWNTDITRAKILFDYAMVLKDLVMMIMFFYFGYYAVSNVIKAKK